MTVTNRFFIGHRYTDKTMTMKNSSILTLFEDIAGMHSNAAGEDYRSSPSRWLLTAYHIKIISKPVYGDEVDITTWSTDLKNITAAREFEVRNKNGDLLIYALSNWAHYNIVEKKFEKVSDDLICAYASEPERTNFESSRIKKLVVPQEFSFVSDMEIPTYWIDVNNHLNNAHYLDMAAKFLSDKTDIEHNIDEIEIMYKHEILPGEKIKCLFSESEKEYTVVYKNEDLSDIHAVLVFRKKM